jgi:hypothetical protein
MFGYRKVSELSSLYSIHKLPLNPDSQQKLETERTAFTRLSSTCENSNKQGMCKPRNRLKLIQGFASPAFAHVRSIPVVFHAVHVD